MWTPRNGLHSGLVFAPLKSRLSVEFFPYHELVIVASGCKLSIFLVPFQPADLLLVTDKLAKPLLRLSNVSMVDCAIS